VIVHVNSATESHDIFGNLREILADLRSSRDLLYQLTLRDVRIRYKQAIMGFGWAVLMPMLIVLSGMVVRYAMATLSGGQVESGAVATMAVKSLPWAFFVGAIGFAVGSLSGNGNLISKIYFPREVLPLAAVFAQAFDTGIASCVVCAVLPFLGIALSWNVLWVPVLLVLLFTLTCAAALLLSAANLFYRDVKYIVQVLLTFGIFFTPVLYEPAMLGPTGARLIMLNPLAPLIEGLRLAVVMGHNLVDPYVATATGQPVLVWSPWYLVAVAVVAVVGLVISAVLFHRAQYRFAEMA
jgi:lipopolysaccharide transport system permease protein